MDLRRRKMGSEDPKSHTTIWQELGSETSPTNRCPFEEVGRRCVRRMVRIVGVVRGTKVLTPAFFFFLVVGAVFTLLQTGFSQSFFELYGASLLQLTDL